MYYGSQASCQTMDVFPGGCYFPGTHDPERMDWPNNFMFLCYRALTTEVKRAKYGGNVVSLFEFCRRGI